MPRSQPLSPVLEGQLGSSREIIDFPIQMTPSKLALAGGTANTDGNNDDGESLPTPPLVRRGIGSTPSEASLKVAAINPQRE